MVRNREILIFVSAIVLFSGIAVFAAFKLPEFATWISLILALGLIFLFLVFTFWRYRKIEELAQVLKRIAVGEYGLDVRDSKEGELDILKSEIYKVTVMLREQASSLLKEKEFLAQALSDISHQLKTPLTSISVMTELLQSETISVEKRVEFTRSILSQIQRLEWLVSALLRMAQMDAGALQFTSVETHVESLIEQAMRHLLIPAEVKNLKIVMEIPVDMRIYCDPNWTSEALTNVIKNAIEHTPTGGQVLIRAEKSPLFDLIEVQDSGEGISAQDLPHIFERFYRARDASKDSIGIGLAMSKSLLEKQNATITARSHPGKGSLFSIKFYKQVV